MTAVLAGVAAALAVLLLAPPPPPRLSVPVPVRPPVPSDGWMHRGRGALAVLAGLGLAVFVGGPPAPAVGLAGGVAVWWFIGRSEPASVRRHREQLRRELPHLVHLLAAALRSGASAGDGVRLACAALPGAAADRVRPVSEHLALGADPGRVWASLADDPDLAALGRCLARSHETGAPVVAAVERLADELSQRARSRVEDRARAVGVRAALPLGLCLLPSFLLLGIVPLVAGLLTGLTG